VCSDFVNIVLGERTPVAERKNWEFEIQSFSRFRWIFLYYVAIRDPSHRVVQVVWKKFVG